MESTYTLSIVLHGPGTDPNNRSHWTLALHRPPSPLATVLQVNVLDLASLTYASTTRNGEVLLPASAEGRVEVGTLDMAGYIAVKRVVEGVQAPNNGKDRCQDWVLDYIVALEVEGVVAEGTSEWVGGLVGRSAVEVEKEVGDRWVRRAESEGS
jgi:hypothetical protein